MTNRVTEKNLKNLENNFNSLKEEKITLNQMSVILKLRLKRLRIL